jgi:cobalt/nickel transport system permease protein
LAALSFLKDSIFQDEIALKNGFLQKIDPRIKTITFLLFLILILLTKSTPILICLYLFCLLLSQFSKINLDFFLKRTWIFIPLFSLFIAVPALFSIFSPGEPLVTFGLPGINLIITHQGLSGALLFVMRVTASVSFVILLNLTTRHTELLKVLRIFKIPQIFVMTLNMCYRYIYLFIEIVEHTYLAIKSRVGSVRIHHDKGRQIVTWKMATLWQRSLQLNEEVYNAMLSRGYTGEPRILDEFKTKARDWAWLFFVIAVFSLLKLIS